MRTVRTDCGRFWGLPHPCVDGSCRYDPDLTSSLRALGQICQTLPFWSTVFTTIHYDSLVLSAMLVYVGRVWGCINVCIASWGEKKSITLRTASQRLWISQTFLVVWQPSQILHRSLIGAVACMPKALGRGEVTILYLWPCNSCDSLHKYCKMKEELYLVIQTSIYNWSSRLVKQFQGKSEYGADETDQEIIRPEKSRQTSLLAAVSSQLTSSFVHIMKLLINVNEAIQRTLGRSFCIWGDFEYLSP